MQAEKKIYKIVTSRNRQKIAYRHLNLTPEEALNKESLGRGVSKSLECERFLSKASKVSKG